MNAMRELSQAIPDYRLMLELEPEELAGKLLFLIRRRGGQFKTVDLNRELWAEPHLEPVSYPRNKQEEIELALIEAWSWLEAQGLVIPGPGTAAQIGFRRLSRRAWRFETEADFANFRTARLLPKEILHPKISQPVWAAFMRGEFDVAAFLAIKAVEVAVRQAAPQLPADLVGVRLVRAAFKPADGPLTDNAAGGGEQQARMDLFAGAIGSLKNPQSHREVGLSDPAEATEIIMVANYLLRIVDERRTAPPSS
jgi:uncharacterized protein (TIGR02391 family)